MSTKARYNAGTQVFFDPGQNYEHVFAMAPVFYEDDFLAAGKQAFPTSGAQGVDWVKKLVQTGGAPAVAGVASALGGQVSASIDATNEKQEATLYWADNKHLDVTKGLVIECRARLSVLPSAAGVQVIWGLANTWIDGPDNNTFYLQFGATANGNVLLRSKDGVTTNSIASGVTVLAADFHTYRLDASDVNDVKYFIDGVQVSANGALKFAATGANAILQPYFGVYKPSGTGVATLLVDYFRAWMNRS